MSHTTTTTTNTHYPEALWSHLQGVLGSSEKGERPLSQKPKGDDDDDAVSSPKEQHHAQTVASYPPIHLSKKKCTSATTITNVKKSFCGQQGVPSLLSLDRLQWDTFVSHAERRLLERVEEDEGRGRIDLVSSAASIVSESFVDISRSLQKMHEERVLSHLQRDLDESAARAAIETQEEARRVPLSHAHTSGLFGSQYLGQILKRGAIVEDDMKRERKFTGRIERTERVQLIQGFMTTVAATIARETANIEHLSMRAESFVKAAKTFHTLYNSTGDSAGSPMRAVMDKRYNVSGKSGHTSTMKNPNTLDTTAIMRIQKALSADPTQYSHARLLKSLLSHKEYTQASKTPMSLDFATSSQGEAVATPQADLTNLVLTLRFISGEIVRVRVGSSDLPSTTTCDHREAAKPPSEGSLTKHPHPTSDSPLFSSSASQRLFQSMPTLCGAVIDALQEEVADLCETSGNDSVFDDLTTAIADVVSEDLRLVCALVVPPVPTKNKGSKAHAPLLPSSLQALMDNLRSDLDAAGCFDTEMKAFVRVLRPVLHACTTCPPSTAYLFSHVALHLLDAIVTRSIEALGTLQQVSEREGEGGEEGLPLIRRVAIFSECCLWLSGAFLMASQVYPCVVKTVGSSPTAQQFTATLMEELTKRAVLHSHAWFHEWCAGLGDRLGVLRSVGPVAHPSYPGNIRLLASHWVRARVIKQQQAYILSKKNKALQERLAAKRITLAARHRARGTQQQPKDDSGAFVTVPIPPPTTHPSLRHTNDLLLEFSSVVDRHIDGLPIEEKEETKSQQNRAMEGAVEWLCGEESSVELSDLFGQGSFICPGTSIANEIATFTCVPTPAA